MGGVWELGLILGEIPGNWIVREMDIMAYSRFGDAEYLGRIRGWSRGHHLWQDCGPRTILKSSHRADLLHMEHGMGY
jgi:hypothetical protein